jgi:hypothetical protein
MPAKIVVTDSSGSETEHWVEDEVIRVGSDAGCDVRLSGRRAAAHTATVEYVNGSYLVYNRSNAAFSIGGRPVAPGATSPWPPGSLLETDGETLELRVEGDPAPSLKPQAGADIASAPDEPTGATGEEPQVQPPAKARSNAALQAGVTLACVVGAALLLLYDPSQTFDSQPQAPSFGHLIRNLCKQESPGDPGLSAIRYDLQSARIAQSRGDDERALALYDAVRDALVARGRLTDCGDGPPLTDETSWDAYSIDCQAWCYVRAHRRPASP